MGGRRLAAVTVVLVVMNGLVGLATVARHDEGAQRVASAGSRNGSAVDRSGEQSTEPAATPPSGFAATDATAESTTTTVATATPADAPPSFGGDAGPGPPSRDGGNASPDPPSAPDPAPAPQPQCHNSHDPACGEFSWTNAVANTPLQWQITWEPQEPKVGEVVTFHFSATDAEGRLYVMNLCFTTYCAVRGDGVPNGPVGYGPWSLALQPSSIDHVQQYTYATAGTYTVRAHFIAGGYRHGEDCPGDPAAPAGSRFDCRDPYQEFVFGSASITVNP